MRNGRARSLSLGPVALTVVAALVPAVLVWWTDRHLLQTRDDPARPELLSSRRRANIRAIAFAVAIMIVFGGASVAWGIPLLIVSLIAVAYPRRASCDSL